MIWIRALAVLGSIGVVASLRISTRSWGRYRSRELDPRCKELFSKLQGLEQFDQCTTESGHRTRSAWEMAGFPQQVHTFETLERDFVVNNHCLSSKRDTTYLPAYTTHGVDIHVGIVVVDTRDSGLAPGHDMWQAYAAKHGYSYLHVKQVHRMLSFDQKMDADWHTIAEVKKLLKDPAYEHITHFMYTELDQWPVSPMAKLEPLFDQAGLVGPSPEKVMAIVSEYPCEMVNGGGRFNAGNFLFVRGHRIMELFDHWDKSRSFWTDADYGPLHPHWPARQGSLHNDVYPKFKEVITVLENGDPLGSPFGSLVAHLTTGPIEGIYAPSKARRLGAFMKHCVEKRVREDDKRPCSLYPEWVGGQCLTCRQSLQVNGKRFPYVGCCGETDSALPLEAFKVEAEQGLLQPDQETNLARYSPEKWANTVPTVVPAGDARSVQTSHSPQALQRKLPSTMTRQLDENFVVVCFNCDIKH